MVTKKPTINIQIPKLDSFDLFAMLLWVGVLVPAVQLPSSATFTFARAIFFILWTALFFLYVAYRIFSEKKMIFYSSTVANTLMTVLGGSFVLSYLLSASRIDSLFGYDLSFASSFLILISLVVFYFSLKLAGLSLEFAVSRIFAVLPFTLAILDITSLFTYLLPAGFFERLLGNYSQYFTFFSNAPSALLGSAQQALFVHIIALLIATWQIAAVYKKGVALDVHLYRRLIVGALLTITASYLFFYTFAFSVTSLVVFVAVAVLLATLIFTNKTLHVKQFGMFTAMAVGIAALLGLVWLKTGIIGDLKPVSVSGAVSSSIIQQSFLNSTTPMWRQLVGFGVGTFPYLYMQYRPIESAQMYGNDTFFFKPSNFVTELFVEHGAIGVLLVAALMVMTVLAYRKASAKDSLVPEATILLVAVSALLTGPSSLVVLIVLFGALASFYDKTESLPELLPSVRAVDFKESTYTNKSVTRSGQLLFVLAFLYLGASVFSIIAPSMTMVGYAKGLQRYAVAKQQVAKKDTKALTTFSDAFALTSSYRQYCKDCAQLSYLSLNTLIGTSNLYSGLTVEQRNSSQELRQVRNMTLQSITDLLNKSTVRYDYWFTVAQAYQAIADDEKSTSLYTLAVQSVRNALSVNQYSIDANYLYVDVLLRLGNDTQINTEIKDKVAILKRLVGTPYQIQFIDAIMLAREQKFADSIKAFEKIEKDVAAANDLSTDDKKALTSLAQQRMEEVKKLQQTPVKPTTTPKPTPSATPTPTTTTN